VLPTLGWRVDEPDGWRMVPDLLEAHGVHGPARAELRETGSVRVDGRRVSLEEVAVPRPGQSMAFVMDTRDCDGARELAAGVDLLVIEATFLDPERELAEEAGHLTAAQATTIAREAGARRTVLTHLSQRYPTLDGHRPRQRPPHRSSTCTSRATSTGSRSPVAADSPAWPLVQASRCSRPTTSPSRPPTSRQASSTPGMNEVRSIESCRMVSV
jgi:ribonuclease BN (tRNA processing enzyme)